MLKHRFDIGKSKTGWSQQTLVIEVSQLDFETLQALPVYLINQVEFIYQKNEEIDEECMWPVMIDINGQFTISEKLLWAMVCDTLPNAKELVIQYLQKLCDLAKQSEYDEFLLYSDEYHFMGAFAVIPFLDWYFKQDESNTAAALPVYDSFIQYIRCCDMDTETFQDEYIEKVLNKLAFFNVIKLVELLCFRLCNGQLADKEFRYLYHFLALPPDEPGRLKLVIDCLSDENNTDVASFIRSSEDIYLRLCAAVYGDHHKETEEVMDYVKQSVGKQLKPIHPRLLPYIQKIRSECEASSAFSSDNSGFSNSSFHLYDQKNKKWLPLE